ncbi:hypothetical protein CPB84DRAFT_1840839 [Gymnopilus junonius]|uniref:Uncharacterized protein n=1 Tax=Gymnopilus junonius TaxID=109634 RepID=A0A9P5P369_GYMJU|nr:hypothetical protein CPB84DRAFT_1840839 [Gymnopilus junonius]
MAHAPGLRSPPPPRSSASSPRPKFDADLLKAYMKKLLSSTLQNSSWPESKDRDKVKGWMKEIGERVKERMLEIQPRGLAGIVCHWEDSDIVAQEMYYNDSLICSMLRELVSSERRSALRNLLSGRPTVRGFASPTRQFGQPVLEFSSEEYQKLKLFLNDMISPLTADIQE